MRGRKPETILAGSSPVTTALKPPAYLSKDGKVEWRRVAPILTGERKVLTEGDIASLENYCIAVGVMRRAERELHTSDLLIAGKRNPLTTILMQAQQQQLRAAAELGLTPSSRSRAPMRDNDENELSFLD